MTPSVSELVELVPSIRQHGVPPIAPRSLHELSAAWQRSGLEPGDLVVVAWPSGQMLLAQTLALLEAGLVPMLVSPAMPIYQLQLVAKECGAKAITQPKIGPSVAGLRTVTRLPFGESVALPHSPNARQTRIEAGDMVLSTSGTSGISSGCVFRFTDLLDNALRHRDAVGLRPDDTVLVALPLYYSYAFVAQALAALITGTPLRIICSPITATTMLGATEHYRATTMSLTPALARSIVRERPELFGQLRMLTVGGDALSVADVERVRSRHQHLEFFLTYGLTEAGPRVSTLAVHREPASRWGSVGTPLPGTRVSLLDPDPVTGIGELTVRSSTVMRGRVGNPEAVSAATWSDAGALRTGDLFTIDDGYLFFKGRSGRFVLRRGEKVCLATLRNTALSLPEVTAARVEVDAEDNLRLLLWLSSGADRDALRRSLFSRLRHAERPDRVDIQDSPPPFK